MLLHFSYCPTAPFGLLATLHLNRAEKVPGMEDLNEASRESAVAKLQEMAAQKGDKKAKVREGRWGMWGERREAGTAAH